MEQTSDRTPTTSELDIESIMLKNSLHIPLSVGHPSARESKASEEDLRISLEDELEGFVVI